MQPELKRITYNQFISRPKTRTTPKTAAPIREVTNNAQRQTSTISFEVAGGRGGFMPSKTFILIMVIPFS